MTLERAEVLAKPIAEVSDEKEFKKLLDVTLSTKIDLSLPLNKQKQTLLHIAALRGFDASVSLLLAYSAPILLDLEHNTPLFALLYSVVKNNETILVDQAKIIADLLIKYLELNDIVALEKMLLLCDVPSNLKQLRIFFQLFDGLITEEYFSRYKDILAGVNDDKLIPAVEKSKIRTIYKQLTVDTMLSYADLDAIILQLQEVGKSVIKLMVSKKAQEDINNKLNKLIDYAEFLQYKLLSQEKKPDAADKFLLNKLRCQVSDIELSRAQYSLYLPYDEFVILKLLLMLIKQLISLSDPEKVQIIKNEINNNISLLRFILEVKACKVDKPLCKSDAGLKDFPLAKQALNYVKEHLKIGNTMHVFDSEFRTSKTREIMQCIKKVRYFIDYSDYLSFDPLIDIVSLDTDDNLFMFKAALDMYQKFSIGNCGEVGILALNYLIMYNFNNPEKAVNAEICKINNGDHSFLAIDREPMSNISDPKTWGEEAYIWDIWSEKVYRSNDYLKYLKNYVLQGDRHAIEDLKSHQTISSFHMFSTEVFKKRNESFYIEQMFSVFKKKNVLFLAIVEELLIYLNMIIGVLKHLPGIANVSKYFLGKIKILQEVTAKAKKLNDRSLSNIVDGMKEINHTVMIDVYTYTMSELQFILRSGVEAVFSISADLLGKGNPLFKMLDLAEYKKIMAVLREVLTKVEQDINALGNVTLETAARHSNLSPTVFFPSASRVDSGELTKKLDILLDEIRKKAIYQR